MKINASNPTSLLEINTYSISQPNQLKKLGIAILNNDLTQTLSLLKEGVDANSIIEVDRELALEIATSSPSLTNSLKSYLQYYFETGMLIFINSEDDIPETFKLLLDKARTILEENKDLPQQLLQDLIQLDREEMEGKFFMLGTIEGLQVSPLALAKECNAFETAQLLIEEGADPYFKTAVSGRLIPIVELEEGADLNDIKFAELFYEKGVPIEYMTSEYFQNSPTQLYLAAEKVGNKDLISFLKKNGYRS